MTQPADRRPDRELAAELRRWSARSVSTPFPTGRDEAGVVLPDPSFDRYARLVKAMLDVPVSLVSIVESDRQIFPGAAGLPADLEIERQTPLSHSFCKHVVFENAPLIVSDARLDPRVSDNLAIPEMGVIGYAGFPLRDSEGMVIGSLCALSYEPRTWTESELTALEDLAAVCSTEITLREMRKQAVDAAREAWDTSHRARVLLALSERLAGTRSLTDVAGALLRVAVEELDCQHAGIWVVDSRNATTMRYVNDRHLAWPQAEYYAQVTVSHDNPFGVAMLTNEPVFFENHAAQTRVFPAPGNPHLRNDGQARTYLPLVVSGRPIGCLVLLWTDRRGFSAEEELTIGALTASAANAVQRASLLDDQATAAAKLQKALLSELPHPPGLELAARYRTAQSNDLVGGDWYDALVLPDGATGLTIGDVAGHDVDATAAMGSLRTMLRTFAWDGDNDPAAVVARLERAVGSLHPGLLCTLIFARAELDADGNHLLRWTNAGHPAPILIHADGRCETLDGAGVDCMIGVVADRDRRDNEVSAESGATLLLFTDGLIKRRTAQLDDDRARLIATLGSTWTLRPEDLVEAVLDEMVDDQSYDDVALLAVRFG